MERTLQHFDRQDFLDNIWQQQPLLIRRGLANFNNPLSAEQLAGLACEEDIESRLIIDKKQQWLLEHGPFPAGRFQQLPASHWTLLVQAVDHYIPAVADLIDYFRFIPNWRIDDVMVSYATTGGSVGPHYDNYDVFLIQGAGKRRWQIGRQCQANEPLLRHDQLRLLADFNAEQEWVLEAGDILYLPPRYAHWGIAEDDQCMTYSVGFRAPSHSEILSHFTDFVIAKLDDHLRYTDAALNSQNNPGEISAAAIEEVQKILTDAVNQQERIAEWFGCYMTEAKYPQDTENVSHLSETDLQERLLSQTQVLRNPSSRIAFAQQAGQLQLFINGKIETLAVENRDFIETLAGNTHYSAKQLTLFCQDEKNRALLTRLFNQDILYFDDERDD